MRLADFDFALPEAQIAQHPLPERDASRLMVLDRRTGATAHRTFRQLPELLREGDLLVLNDTRVIPARLFGRKVPTGGRVELLLVRPAADVSPDVALRSGAGAVEWVCLGQASKGLKPGARVEFDGGFEAQVVEALGGGEYRVQFTGPPAEPIGTDGRETLGALLEAQGKLPLPPYIDREATSEDLERYQTIFARVPGSVAAPTAALHFTPAVFAALDHKGVQRATVTLDVGPGTFLPVRDTVEGHKMHTERYFVPEQTAAAVARTKAAGGRVVAVGTTVVRTLESATDPGTGALRPGPGATELFITPGFAFRQIDALLTNFHLPKSTLLMLVSAFAGQQATLAAYRQAVALGYRFFSYGDSMFIAEGAA